MFPKKNKILRPLFFLVVVLCLFYPIELLAVDSNVRIEMERAIQSASLTREQAIRQAEIAQASALEIAEQERSILIAAKNPLNQSNTSILLYQFYYSPYTHSPFYNQYSKQPFQELLLAFL